VTPLYPQKLALTSLTGGGRSIGIVRSRTQAMEFSFFSFYIPWYISEDGDSYLKYTGKFMYMDDV
jgi:hypothetical protein